MNIKQTIKKTKKTLKNKKNIRKSKKTRKTYKKKGGLFGAVKDAFNSGDKQTKSNQENISYIAKINKSGWFHSNIVNVEYIIPSNFIMFKNPDSFFTPLFFVHINNNPVAEPCYIQISEPRNPNRIKFIEYIIFMNGNWYCMMRIYGINTGFFATMTNVVFYKLTNSWFNITNNSIHFPDKSVTIINKSELNILQKVAIKDNGTIIRINSGYTEITGGDDYYILRQFRNGQMINAEAKQNAVEKVAEWGFNVFFDNK